MRSQARLASLFTIVALVAGEELLACGDKFLVGSRGTRYQRPKNARAASIVIYAAPSADRPAAASAKIQSFLAQQGHQAVIATTLDQLSTIVSRGRFDVVLAANDAVATIQQLVAGVPNAAVVLSLGVQPRKTTLLSAIDAAVARRDQGLPRN